MLKFKKYHSKLQMLYNKQNDLINQYNEAIELAECLSCNLYSSESCYENRHKKCGDCTKSKTILIIARELDKISVDIDDFIENEYAQAVFEYYNKKKPTLVRIRTDEKYAWEEAFGSEFDRIEKTLKHSLVGLVENTGRYKIK